LIPQRGYFSRVATLVTQSLHQHPLRLALSAGLVSAFFSIMWQAIEEFLTLAPHEQLRELIVIAVVSIGMLLAIEPILERIGPVRVHESFRREDDILIRAGALLTIVATSLLHGLLHGHISQSLTIHGMLVLEELATALIAPTLITLSWIYGMRRERPQARWYGLTSGVLVGLGLVTLAMVQLYFFQPAAGPHEASSRTAAMTMAGVATSMWFVVPTCAVNGYLGGLAIDRRWLRKVWRAVALGLIVAALVEAGSFWLAWFVGSRVLDTAALIQPQSLASLTAEAVIAYLGWSMGLFVNPYTDALLGNAQQPATERELSSELSIGVAAAVVMFALGLLLSLGALTVGNHATALLLGG
jgi:hypothetical protein